MNNDLMAVRKEHPIMKKMMESLKRRNWNLIFPYLTIFWSTGPQFTSDMLKEWFLLYEGRSDGYVKGTSKRNPGMWQSHSLVCIHSRKYTAAILANSPLPQIPPPGLFSPKSSTQKNTPFSVTARAAHGMVMTSLSCYGLLRIRLLFGFWLPW